MPRPNRGESESDFVSRYVGSAEAAAKYPDEKQRLAIAYSIYSRRSRRKKRKLKKNMEITLELLLDSIKTRKSVSAAGISVASAFFSSIGDCLTGAGMCPASIFKMASAELWQKELAEASGRLTFCSDRDASGADLDCLSKSYREGSDILKGAVLEYDAIWSTKSKDRDGDIMEQKGGLEVDLRMPLLWQHIQVQPIGKHVALLEQDEFLTKSRFAIADTELGRDAAVLVKFGALRKSHGFKPGEFAPIEIVKDANGQQRAKGWHIKKAKTMEASLVSIPANPETSVLAYYEKEFDGIATAFSRGDLKSEPVKRWAKSVYDARPLQIAGVELKTKAETSCMCATKAAGGSNADNTSPASGSNLATKTGPSEPMDANASGMDPTKVEKCPKCGGAMTAGGKCSKCEYVKEGPAKAISPDAMTTKAAGDLTTKAYGDNPYLDGSFEAIRWSLDDSSQRYLFGKGVIKEVYRGYCYLVATFADSAIVSHRDDGKTNCYRIPYGMVDGVATFNGDPVSVDIKTSVVEKAAEAMLTKAAKSAEGFVVPPAQKSISQLSTELISRAMTSADPSTQKALDDVAGAAQILRQQREIAELNELLMIDG